MANTQFRTSTDLINEALAMLGVLSPGQSTDPEDFNYVSEMLDSLLRKLAQLEIVYIPDPTNIPGAWFLDLAACLAGECAAKFGATPSDQANLVYRGLGGCIGPNGQWIQVGAGAAALSLKQQLRGRPTWEPLRALYF